MDEETGIAPEAAGAPTDAIAPVAPDGADAAAPEASGQPEDAQSAAPDMQAQPTDAAANAPDTPAQSVDSAETAATGVEAQPGDAVPLAPDAGAVDAATGAAAQPADGALTSVPAPDSYQAALDLVDAGGPVVIILLVMSVIALAIIIAKLWQFAGAGLTDSRPIDRVLAHWRRGHGEAALDAARAGRGPAARALAAALQSGPAAEPERAREAAWLAATQELESARSWLRPLEIIGSLAPLLGLFGTVLGMIAAFAELEAAGSRVDPSILSGGIWVALLTTAVGLAVAIPAVAAFNWFERRIERAEGLAERAVAALFSAAQPSAEAPARLAEPVAAEARFRAVAPG